LRCELASDENSRNESSPDKSSENLGCLLHENPNHGVMEPPFSVADMDFHAGKYAASIYFYPKDIFNALLSGCVISFTEY
jgi:hypothetical protein